MAENDLKNLLNPNSGGDLGKLVQRARELGELTHTLCESLPDEFSGAIVAANVRADGDLVVIAASSAWASRLRYEADALLASARLAGHKATSCRIRVAQS